MLFHYLCSKQQPNIFRVVMKLILMTRPEFFIEEHQILTALFDEGLETLHLRKPYTEPIFSERLVSLIPKVYRKNIVVHDHFYLVGEYGLKGIHLNQRNSTLPNNYKGSISCSCSTSEELEARDKFCNYLFLSPLFDNNDNQAFSAHFTPQLLRQMSQQKQINKRVMAFGNVGLDNVPLLREYAFGGAVVFGDIWNRFDLHSSRDFKDLISHFRKLRKALAAL